MTSTEKIIEEWRNKPAPLLGMLHAFHERDHCITEETIRAISTALQKPNIEIYGTVSFYDHLSMKSGSQEELRICTGPICTLKGSVELLDAMKDEGARGMPCCGRCDIPVAALRGNHSLAFSGDEILPRPETPLPIPNPGGLEECVFNGIRASRRRTLDGYRDSGGYRGLEKALNSMTPESILTEIGTSALTGRGGAGFPTGAKWRAVALAPGNPKYIVCNADEGEPGCFKDRAVLDHDPHALIEGMTLAALATGATEGFIYLRYEYPETFDILTAALEEARGANLLGQKILASELNFEIHLRRGGGAYICGEETSLLNSLEGKYPSSRNRPPYPVTHGFNDLPTAVNNVETLASVPWIIVNGAERYRNLGYGDNTGTKVISLSGDVTLPGNYEVPVGFPLKTLIDDWAGGIANGKKLQAVSMAGLSGGFLGAADVAELTLDEKCIRALGSFLGAGGIMVFDETRDMVAIGRQAMSFMAHESCGKCSPCRIGTQKLTERLGGKSFSGNFQEWRFEVEDICNVMKSSSSCGLGKAAPLIAESLLRLFPDSLADLAEN